MGAGGEAINGGALTEGQYGGRGGGGMRQSMEGRYWGGGGEAVLGGMSVKRRVTGWIKAEVNVELCW